MLASSKIALLCGALALTAPACAALLGDFDPAVTGGSGGAGGATSSSGVTSNVTTGVGGMTTGPGGTGSVTSGPGSGGGSSGSTSGGGGSDPATGSASSSGAATASASSSTGGVTCTNPKTDCGAPPACSSAICSNGGCSTTPLGAGTLLPDQTIGNCKKSVCDGIGGTTDVADNSDLPAPMNDCYTGTCQSGSPKQAAKALNTACTSNGGSYCDGSGTCVECNNNLQCGGPTCLGHTCSGPSCNDLMQNGDESDVDCGGSCKKCNFGQMCQSSLDCNSNNCLGGVCS